MSLFEGEKTAFKWLPALMRKRCRLLISPTTKEEVMFEEEGEGIQCPGSERIWNKHVQGIWGAGRT